MLTTLTDEDWTAVLQVLTMTGPEEAPHEQKQSARSPRPTDTRMMAPPSGGFNIAPAPNRPHELDREFAPRQEDRLSAFQPSGAEKSHPEKHKAPRLLLGVLSLIFNALMLAGLAGPLLMTLLDTPDEQVSDLASAVPSDDHRPQASANLIVTNQKGLADEPLPLGIVVKNGSGEETVTISGLGDGVVLSLGTSQRPGEWSLPVHDLDLTYVGSFKNSAPVVQAAAKLYSASGRLLDSQVIRFEWLKRGEGEIKPFELTRVGHPQGSSREQAEPVALEQTARFAGAEAQPSFVREARAPTPEQVHPSAATEAETLVQHRTLDGRGAAEMLRLGENLLNRGDIAAARLALERAAAQGDAQAAFELAMTFDQFFLRRWGAVGTLSDTVKARQWYDKAMMLGAREASPHLDRLSRKTDSE